MTDSLSWPLLLKRTSAWAHVAALPRTRVEEFAATAPKRKHAAIRILRGNRCAARDALFEEFARGLDFPDYFGKNWDALEDCLTDLEWLSAEAFVVIVTNADQILKNTPGELKTLAGILASASRHWVEADPPASFHCLFQCEPESAGDLRQRLSEGGIALS